MDVEVILLEQVVGELLIEAQKLLQVEGFILSEVGNGDEGLANSLLRDLVVKSLEFADVLDYILQC